VTSKSDLSVVVVVLVGGDSLANCLDRLPVEEIDCVVALEGGLQDVALWERRYPATRFLASDDPIPVRRSRAVECSVGDIVGLIEDTSWPNEDWCAAVRSAFTDPQIGAAGGSVSVAPTLPSRCQALGWTEYSAFTPNHLRRSRKADHAGAAPMQRVPGNNMAFRREDLIAAMAAEGGTLFEADVCDRLRAHNRRVVYQPGMSVTYSSCDWHGAALGARFQHGRLHSALLVGRHGWPSRLFVLAKAPLLPLVLLVRTIIPLVSDGKKRKLVRLVLWIGIMQTAWAFGEATGAVAGSGDSMKAWR
jgi:hypothetical protein